MEADLSGVSANRCLDMHDIETMEAEELRHQIRMQTDVIVQIENRTARMERILNRALKRRNRDRE